MNGKGKPDIRSLSLSEIRDILTGEGAPEYRARQIHEWLWRNNAHSFTAMSNLPVSLRSHLEGLFTFHIAREISRQKSSDGSEKVAFRLHDGKLVEAVYIPTDQRSTVCISSQVGCALQCRFCATGTMGFSRNLLPGEMVDQLTGTMDRPGHSRELPDNIVFMGMGEPLMNYRNVSMAIGRITAPDGLGMSPQRITVSSAGIPSAIRKMADDGVRYQFALSLHAASDEKRNKIMPLNQRFPLQEVSDALVWYHQKTGQRITIEYILFDQFNDTLKDAADLARFCKRFPVKINLIGYNPVPGLPFNGSSAGQTRRFAEALEARNMIVNIRLSKGKDIDAACGQLAGNLKDKLIFQHNPGQDENKEL
jgi:23S rRNA (adenine2503-C2)-methyltransferase